MEVGASQVPADVTKSLENVEISNSGSEESEESVEPKVPDQLMMEFLINIMKHDYGTAEKLCQMILLYDPENEQALSFQPLLKDMLQAIKDNAENDDDSSSESETEDSSESDSDEDDPNSNADSDEESESDTTDQD